MNAYLKCGLFVLTIMCHCGCASNSNLELVGLWREKSDGYNAVVLRKADGNYLGKRIQDLDVAKPALFIMERGRWWVKGENYFVEIVEKTTNSDSVEHRDGGKPIKYGIQSINPVRFVYLSPDGAVVTERRIGEASDPAFNAATVSQPDTAKNQ